MTNGISRRSKSLRVIDQPLHPGELVGEFVGAGRVAVRDVGRGDAHLAAIALGGERRLDIARLLVVEPGQAAPSRAPAGSTTVRRRYRRAAQRLDPVAERRDLEPREIVGQAFYLLQAQDVGLGALQEVEQMRQPHLDRIDVPARDFHDASAIRTLLHSI